jgi:hypothetical protein
MKAGQNPTWPLRWLQLALLLAVFCLDFGHGIVLREHNIAFHPAYRMRQTLAVAISRMHTPPAQGYLAYQSVIDSLNQNGFALFPEDKGPHLDVQGWRDLFKDTEKVDGSLRDAMNIVADVSLPPQLIRGNELGYADYMYMAFRLFGLRIASLYYFYFLLLGITCMLFVSEYWRSPFSIFLLTTYLGGLFFLQNYVQTEEYQTGTLANSRVFEALSLVPAIHIFMAIWLKLPPRRLTVVTVAMQSALLAFLIGCRTTVMWQIVMIVVAGLGILIAGAWDGRHLPKVWQKAFLSGGWPAALALLVVAVNIALIDFTADSRYRQEPKAHIIWHEVLRGILSTNLKLQDIYLGKQTELGDAPDTIVYDAILRDLNARHDASSPIAYVENGRIWFDIMLGHNEYEKLARSLTVRIIVAHPVEVIGSIAEKFSEQIDWFNRYMQVGNLIGAMAIAGLAGLLWVASGGRVLLKELVHGLGAILTVLAFSLVPPLIAPSYLSVGTLLCFLVAATAALFAGVVIAASATDRIVAGKSSPNVQTRV